MRSVHLIIVIHGLYGSTLNLSVVEEELMRAGGEVEQGAEAGNRKRGAPSSTLSHVHGRDRRRYQGGEEEGGREEGEGGGETVVYLAQSIKGSRTWDGIDVCAHRIAEEVDKEIERLQDVGKDVTGFSVMGYSMGGLYARYLIGLLHARQPSFFSRHRPVSFSTAATPHLGVLRYATRSNAIITRLGRVLFSRTGRQIFCQDKEPEWGGRSLLEFMAEPDHVFVKALKLFPKIMLVVNGCHDLTVPYPTAAISSTDPFADPSNLILESDDNHIVKSYLPVPIPDPESLPVDHSADIDADGEEVTVTVSTTMYQPTRSVIGRTRPPVPPLFVLPLRYPFNYTLWLLFPILIPIFLLYVATMFAVHDYHSRRRTRSHLDAVERQPLLTSSVNLVDETSNGVIPNARERTFELDSGRDKTYDQLEDPMSPQIAEEDQYGTSTPLMIESASAAGQPLLTPIQRVMITNLNEAIPHLERLISWFPWEFNSHGLIICRDVSRFPSREDGRGIVRAWANYVVSAGKS
ncbi:hypothetical protein IAR55_002036 [Kwoniella newhampshirensis]|uniref:DUF676 domain-containing protein n=1 Tax=Kwoniella newhampshirensis TaxID=1651941 RepID=A0AAW0YQ22_9TREE